MAYATAAFQDERYSYESCYPEMTTDRNSSSERVTGG